MPINGGMGGGNPFGGSDPWTFANQQGDPNGNMSQDQAKAWAEAYAKQNPGWAGNESFFIGPDGKAHDRRSWIARNGWVIPLLVGSGVGLAALAGAGAAGGAAGAATGASGAAGGAGAAGAAGAATTGAVAAGAPAATAGLGGLTLPGAVSAGSMGLGAAGTAGAVGASGGASAAGAGGGGGLFGGAGGYTSAGNFVGGGAAGGNAAAIGAGGTYGAGGNFMGATGAGAFGGSSIGGSSAATGGGLMSKLLNKDTLTEAGRGISAISKTQAENRGSELDAMMEADKMRFLMERDRREAESDLWQKLQAMNYVKSGGKKPTGNRMSASGRQIPTFGFGPSPISAADQQVASQLEKQLMARLNNPPTLRDYESKMKPGKMETITNWAGPALSLISKFF